MQNPNSKPVQAHESDTLDLQLFERVAVEKEIAQDDAPVALLFPALPIHSQELHRVAIIKMRELSERNRLDGLRVQDLFAEGRK